MDYKATNDCKTSGHAPEARELLSIVMGKGCRNGGGDGGDYGNGNGDGIVDTDGDGDSLLVLTGGDSSDGGVSNCGSEDNGANLTECPRGGLTARAAHPCLCS